MSVCISAPKLLANGALHSFEIGLQIALMYSQASHTIVEDKSIN